MGEGIKKSKNKALREQILSKIIESNGMISQSELRNNLKNVSTHGSIRNKIRKMEKSGQIFKIYSPSEERSYIFFKSFLTTKQIELIKIIENKIKKGKLE
jgi:predicted transcriptional regulator